jgi:hypothetical protein
MEKDCVLYEAKETSDATAYLKGAGQKTPRHLRDRYRRNYAVDEIN